jgi:arsenate reductase
MMRVAMLKVYQYPKCSTCKKALAFLRERGLAFEAIDISMTPPSKEELMEMIRRRGSIRPLFNTSGIKYREGKLSERIPAMSEAEAVDILAQEGMLVKRPFVVTDTMGLLGFKPEEWEKLA